MDSNIYKTQPKANLPTVLAVDDFYLNLLMTKNAISDIVNLYTAKSARDAIKTLESVKVDLLLLDLEMPEMSGLVFLEQLRSMPKYEKLPVIIVSSNARLKTINKTLEYGIVDYITKPFEPALLREKVVKVVSQIEK